MTKLGNTPRGLETRNIRKGTTSCWQCKRRKVRCNLDTAANGICYNCRRRGSLCVSQSLADCSGNTNDNADRIGQVETRIEQLANSINASGMLKNTNDITRPAVRQARGQERSSAFDRTCDPKQTSLHLAEPATAAMTNHCLGNDLAYGYPSSQSAWPGDVDLEEILTLPACIIWCLRALVTSPLSTSTSLELPTPKVLLRSPCRESRPMTTAKRLLLLALFIQSCPVEASQSFAQIGSNYRDIMTHAAQVAHGLLNRYDDSLNSVEGIECLTLESMFYDQAGNLCRAWLSMRRAISIAQLLGFHEPSTNKAEAHGHAKHALIWFRLMQGDRYLSLMHGLPQASCDESFATEQALANCTPLDRLQRLDCQAAGRILQHKETGSGEWASTREVDELLQRAASSVDPQWWLIPDLTLNPADQADQVRQIDRVIDQMAHFHLIAALHLLQILRSSTDKNSTVTAVTAGREVVARFLALHSAGDITVHCRGMYHVAFVSSVILCFAHIDAASQNRCDPRVGHNLAFPSHLTHHRPMDRGMVEGVLEAFNKVAHTTADPDASKLAALKRLLSIEEDCNNGRNCRILSAARGETESNEHLTNNSDEFLMDIPSVGKIRIEPDLKSMPASCGLKHADGLEGIHEQSNVLDGSAPTFQDLDSSRDVDYCFPFGGEQDVFDPSFCDLDVNLVDDFI